MSDGIGPFEVSSVKVGMAMAPPVYAPGGPVALVFEAPETINSALFAAIEAEASARGAVLLVVQCPLVSIALEALLLDTDYNFASSWFFGPTAGGSGAQPDHMIRKASAIDVPRILELGETKREQYATFSPVFWKKAAVPRNEFAPYVTSQVESADNIALVYEVEGEIRAYLIAQCRNLTEGYVDDYAVADPATDWPGPGAELLTEASRLAAQRNFETFAIVTGHADAPKRAAVEALGFVLRKNWLVKALTR